MPRLARTRKLMRLARETNHHRWNLAVLQRAEHLLPTFAGRRPVVGVPKDQHQRRRQLVHVGDWGSRVKVLRILPGRLLEPGRLEQREVGGEPEAVPVGDIALRDRGLEALRLRDRPVGQEPPPLPPVTPMRVVSTYPRFTTSSTPAIKSL